MDAETKAEIQALRILLVAAILELAPKDNLSKSLKKLEALIYKKNHLNEKPFKKPIKQAIDNILDGISGGSINPYCIDLDEENEALN